MTTEMTTRAPHRNFRRGVALLFPFIAALAIAQQTQYRQPVPIERRAPAMPQPAQPTQQPRNNNQQTGLVPGRPVKNQQHLADWMESHRTLPLQQQQSALENEPGFHTLKPQEQQRMHQQLERLNSMPPQQQQRTIQRAEAMERLAPAQRQQIRGAAAQLGSLPPDRQKVVARAFHQAMQMPEEQRQAWLNSPESRAQLNDRERGTLNNLVQVAPAARQAGLPWFNPPAPANPYPQTQQNPYNNQPRF